MVLNNLKIMKTIKEDLLIKEIEKTTPVFGGLLYMSCFGFNFQSYSGAFNTDSTYEFFEKEFTVSERDVTSDEENEQGLSYSEFEFELIEK